MRKPMQGVKVVNFRGVEVKNSRSGSLCLSSRDLWHRIGYVHKGEYKAVLGDLLDVILLEDRLALLFRDSIQYVRVQ